MDTTPEATPSSTTEQQLAAALGRAEQAEVRLELATAELRRTLRRIEDYKVFAAQWRDVTLLMVGDLAADIAMLAQEPDGQPKPPPLAGSWLRRRHSAGDIPRELFEGNWPPPDRVRPLRCGPACSEAHTYDGECLLKGLRTLEQEGRYPKKTEFPKREAGLPDPERDREAKPYYVPPLDRFGHTTGGYHHIKDEAPETYRFEHLDRSTRQVPEVALPRMHGPLCGPHCEHSPEGGNAAKS